MAHFFYVFTDSNRFLHTKNTHKCETESIYWVYHKNEEKTKRTHLMATKFNELKNVAKINHVQLVTALYFAIRMHAMYLVGVFIHMWNKLNYHFIPFLVTAFHLIFFFFRKKRLHEKTDNLGSQNAIRFVFLVCIFRIVSFSRSLYLHLYASTFVLFYDYCKFV